MLALIDNSAAIYQFTIVIIFITSIVFFVGMYWYSISLQKSMSTQEQTRQSLLINSHELQKMQLRNQILETERSVREEKTLRLQQEIDLKNNELVSSTLMLNQHIRFVDEIENLAKELEKQAASTHLKKLLKLVKSQKSKDANWDTFKKRFEHVHPNFVKKIEIKHPNLTPTDLRHCAYMRMRLSTKEIARLMNVVPTSIQISRVRIKKKLGLKREEDLRSFIASF